MAIAEASKRLDSGLERVERLFHRIGVASMAAILVVTAAGMVSRAALGFSLHGSLQIVAYLMVGATFLPLAYVRRNGELISVRLIVDRLPVKVTLWHTRVVTLVELLVSAGLLAAAATVALSYHDRGMSSGREIAMPIAPIAAVMALGLLLLTVELMVSLLGRDEAESHGGGASDGEVTDAGHTTDPRG
ncbi:TRAP transporter small permease [Georgenia sp. 10Sc9-8]|uniref:TRAP transporter small permease n=1 Tax=Georgenia halotolerans TaxID=3028317 RepID=A0ABT5TZ54_9MICO|nr:TRAP transporter small permease [Georgenia halotolerans]